MRVCVRVCSNVLLCDHCVWTIMNNILLLHLSESHNCHHVFHRLQHNIIVHIPILIVNFLIVHRDALVTHDYGLCQHRLLTCVAIIAQL